MGRGYPENFGGALWSGGPGVFGLNPTNFKNADLTEVNFFEADLLKANFEGALFDKAGFLGSRNIPSGRCVSTVTDKALARAYPTIDG